MPNMNNIIVVVAKLAACCTEMAAQDLLKCTLCTDLPASLEEIRDLGFDQYHQLILDQFDFHGIQVPEYFRTAKLSVTNHHIYCYFKSSNEYAKIPLARVMVEILSGRELPKGYEVHHTNGAYDNNFDKLLLIPAELHKRYHCLIRNPGKHRGHIPAGKEYDSFQKDLFDGRSYSYLMRTYDVSNGYVWRERCRAGLICTC